MRLDVSGVAPSGCRTLAAEALWAPSALAAAGGPLLAVCFPGGGMTRRYFDLPLAGYSMAEDYAARGMLVVLVDHPGVGASDVPDDPWELTTAVVADVEAGALSSLRQELAAGLPGLGPVQPTLTVGIGHSAGAHVLLHQQARHPAYDAVALLGWAGRGLPEFLDDGDRELAALVGAGAAAEVITAATVAGARRHHPQPLAELRRGSSKLLVANPMPEDVHRAIVEVRWPLLAVVGYSSMIPGMAAQAAAAIDVPVFLGVGERDIAQDPSAIPAAFPRSGDLTLYVLAGAGHNHNVEPNRSLLWDRLATWSAGLPAGRPGRPSEDLTMYAAAGNSGAAPTTTE